MHTQVSAKIINLAQARACLADSIDIKFAKFGRVV